uniref:Transmembrane protein 54a n=1 Tax=Amphilophus citrinellus TaxID=61819 RepID=A0A3Q0T2A2_AMPCI
MVNTSKPFDNKVLMKMGLGLVLVGHINFLLGALVHGTVLRHSVFPQSSNKVYTISNIIAILAGLLVSIRRSNTDSCVLLNTYDILKMWVLLVFSFLAGLLALASTMAVLSSVIKAIMSEGHSLLTHCTDIHKITDECPFDPTRIYGTTIILWVPLIFMSIVETVFSFHCFAACTSFIRLCPCRKKPVVKNRVSYTRDTEADTEAGPTERDDLLDSSTAEVQSAWL